MIRDFFQRRNIRRVFSRYISRDVVEAIASGQLASSHGLRAGEIGYVLAWVRGDNPEQISDRMGGATNLVDQYGGLVDCIVSGLIVVSFGTVPLADCEPDRPGLVSALIQEFGKNIKLVHGSCTGHFGNLGGPKRMAYTFVLPDFEPALSRLCALPFGQMEEYHSAQRGA